MFIKLNEGITEKYTKYYTIIRCLKASTNIKKSVKNILEIFPFNKKEQ